jgi:hypothetical protein
LIVDVPAAIAALWSPSPQELLDDFRDLREGELYDEIYTKALKLKGQGKYQDVYHAVIGDMLYIDPSLDVMANADWHLRQVTSEDSELFHWAQITRARNAFRRYLLSNMPDSARVILSEGGIYQINEHVYDSMISDITGFNKRNEIVYSVTQDMKNGSLLGDPHYYAIGLMAGVPQDRVGRAGDIIRLYLIELKNNYGSKINLFSGTPYPQITLNGKPLFSNLQNEGAPSQIRALWYMGSVLLAHDALHGKRLDECLTALAIADSTESFGQIENMLVEIDRVTEELLPSPKVSTILEEVREKECIDSEDSHETAPETASPSSATSRSGTPKEVPTARAAATIGESRRTVRVLLATSTKGTLRSRFS